MPPSDSPSALSLSSDESLVAACQSGHRGAFATIVERYQRLLCSLAYSATGRLSQSEDLAQEAFIEAWRQLPKLREPDKLRAWLCGILRHKIHRLRRNDGRQPVHGAAPLDEIGELESDDEPAADLAVRAEEQQLLWSTLERIPETYRTPLVLYYREHQSIEHVAVALELSEDAVKQRLSRGRKLLQERMLNFVEGALARSTPGKVFTLSVLAALPELATPAHAAVLGAGTGAGAAAAKGGLLAKSTVLAALLASSSGIVSAAMGLRSSLDRARTPTERRAVTRITLVFCGLTFALLGVLYGLRSAALVWAEHRVLLAVLAQIVTLGATVFVFHGIFQAMRQQRELRSAERQRFPEHFADPRDQVGSTAGVYRSSWTLLGVPLVHIRFSLPDAGEGPVVGWIAGGDRAYGLLLAWGGVAIAPISAGVASIGLLTVGTASIGVISLGTFALGGLVLGCATIGIKALAWLSALGWHSAQSGGFAIAGLAAEGRIALAEHANNEAARAILADPNQERTLLILLSIIALFALAPITYYARAVRHRFARPRSPNP